MAGYSRQSAADIIANAIIKAAPVNAEYNAIRDAFAFIGGHKHDGSSTEGAYIPLIADVDSFNKVVVDTNNNRISFYSEVGGAAVEQVRIQDGAIVPVTDDDIDLGASGAEFKDLYIDGTAYLDAINFNGTAISATAAELNIMDGVTATTAELNLMDGVTATTAELNIMDGVTATAAELNILDASGSTIGSLSEISTIANDDVFLALDTSGGGIKKVSRSTVVSGLATSSAISNVAEDSTPQLGGNLDLNGNDIVTTSNATLDLAPNGTGTVVVRGNTNSGAVVFNCESNSHGQKVYGQPHSAGVTNTLMLPAGANSTLVSLVSTDTLTNKTLTSPKINENVAVTSTATELNIIDGDTSAGTTAVAGGDGIVTNDNGTMRQTTVDTFDTYLSATTKTLTNKTLTTPTLTTPIANAGVQLKNGATSAGFLEFFEDSDNGTNKVTLIGPASTADITLTLPSTAGTLATTASVTTVAQDEATALAIALG